MDAIVYCSAPRGVRLDARWNKASSAAPRWCEEGEHGSVDTRDGLDLSILDSQTARKPRDPCLGVRPQCPLRSEDPFRQPSSHPSSRIARTLIDASICVYV